MIVLLVAIVFSFFFVYPAQTAQEYFAQNRGPFNWSTAKPLPTCYDKFKPKTLVAAPLRELNRITSERAPFYNHTCVAQTTTKWNVCDPRPCGSVNRKVYKPTFPKKTAWGQNTGEFVDEVMRAAWGPNPPWIDLYVRAGCRGADEMRHLLATVEVFWPRFFGDVLVVLDYGDETVLDHILPPQFRKHSYHVVYEHCPCLPPRIFNQYSYITLDRYTQAQFVVTLDSDCALHTPVTPDVLFNEKGELKLAVATIFQQGMWNRQQEIITGTSKYGHSMTTQPVAFITSTLPAFREWVKNERGKCYEDLVIDAANDGSWGAFCWMCQLNIFISAANVTGYDVHYVEERPDVYVRYGIHTTYEKWKNLNYESRTNQIAMSGLCLWFGEQVFPSCKRQDLEYMNYVMWVYAGANIMPNVNATTKASAIAERRGRLHEIVRYLEKPVSNEY